MSENTAVVTGAASGIGLALTRSLLARGFRVLAIDRDPRSLMTLEGALEVARVDVRDSVALEELARRDRAPLRYLFANAGVGVPGSVLGSPLDRWDWAFDVNVLGVVRTVRAFWPQLLAQKGTVVATVSAAALQSYPGATLYRATKAALLSVMESLHYESRGTGVRLHALLPGMVRSNIAEVDRYDEFRADASDTAGSDPFAAIVREAMKTAEDPDEFARRVLDELAASPPFYWLTHDETRDFIVGRNRAILEDGTPFADFGARR